MSGIRPEDFDQTLPAPMWAQVEKMRLRKLHEMELAQAILADRNDTFWQLAKEKFVGYVRWTIFAMAMTPLVFWFVRP